MQKLKELILETAEQMKLKYSQDQLACDEYDFGKPLHTAEEMKKKDEKKWQPK